MKTQSKKKIDIWREVAVFLVPSAAFCSQLLVRSILKYIRFPRATSYSNFAGTQCMHRTSRITSILRRTNQNFIPQQVQKVCSKSRHPAHIWSRAAYLSTVMENAHLYHICSILSNYHRRFEFSYTLVRDTEACTRPLAY